MKRPGITLMEVLVCAMITGIISSVLVAYFITTARVWYRCSSFMQAFPAAYAVVSRLNRELKNAYTITVPANQTSVTFDLPQTDATGVNIVPFTLGREISYYCSDSSGKTNKSGTVLWRKETNGVTGKIRLIKLASNVKALSFVCNATQSGRVFAIYSSAVTTQGQEHATKYTSNFTTALAIRNPTGP